MTDKLEKTKEYNQSITVCPLCGVGYDWYEQSSDCPHFLPAKKQEDTDVFEFEL